MASARGKSESQESMGNCLRVSLFGSHTFHPALFGLVLAAACVGGAYAGQEERKRKVPVLDKLNSGPTQQAFTGIIQSLDLGHSLLNVNGVQGGATEIFPVKKTIHVAGADGARLKLETLKPGTNVLIYYEQKGDRRTVKDIVVLRAAPPRPAPAAKEAKSTPPS